MQQEVQQSILKNQPEWLLQQWQEKLGVEIKIDMIEWNVMWDRG